ncbi:MAG: phenylalanine--tRNA ligase subunit beta, partial [Elusimicrobia bacterium RIFOXYB2_FULL_48_7]
MKVSYNWLKEFIPIEPYTPAQVAEILLSIGMEVEEMTSPASVPDTVISARIKTITKHPNADKLTVCSVTDGTTDYQIVCGAKNINPGDKVPLALPGSKLPNGMEIKTAAIRGVESGGMLCSSKELALDNDHSGILILPGDTVLGKTLNELMELDDVIFDVAVYPNRPDCLSIMGIAREIAAKLGLNLKLPEIYNPRKPESDLVGVEIADSELCGRYIASYLTDIQVVESPLKIKSRLINHGLRPINNVVDITNYVLLELGHPLHAFDMEKLEGRRITVRKAAENEEVLALNNNKYKLSPDMLVIADAKNPQAIAGVIGAQGSGVVSTTKNMVLESAVFKPQSVRNTAKMLNISTDASYRFERGSSWEACELSAKRALFLLLQNTKGTFVSINDTFKNEPVPRKIILRTKRLNKVLGVQVDKTEICGILLKLHLQVEPHDDDLNVTIPAHRLDLTEEIDLIEEVARMKGYDSIPATAISARIPDYAMEEPLLGVENKIRNYMSGQGFSEAVNYSFYKNHLQLAMPEGNEIIEIANPLSKDVQFLRPSLLPALLGNVEHNLNNQLKNIKLYELGKVFRKNGLEIKESNYLGIIVTGDILPTVWKAKSVESDYYFISGIVQNLLSEELNLPGL